MERSFKKKEFLTPARVVPPYEGLLLSVKNVSCFADVALHDSKLAKRIAALRAAYSKIEKSHVASRGRCVCLRMVAQSLWGEVVAFRVALLRARSGLYRIVLPRAAIAPSFAIAMLLAIATPLW